jgi:two-component system phosphate regulon response regulator PhoB
VKVLTARVEAILRRTARPVGEHRRASLGPIEVDPDTHEVFVDGQPIRLTLTEFRLISTLVMGQGKVLSRNTLMTRAMGPGVTVTERTIDVHVTSIRKKLGQHAGMIRTVRGVGYRLTVDADDSDGDDIVE